MGPGREAGRGGPGGPGIPTLVTPNHHRDNLSPLAVPQFPHIQERGSRVPLAHLTLRTSAAGSCKHAAELAGREQRGSGRDPHVLFYRFPSPHPQTHSAPFPHKDFHSHVSDVLPSLHTRVPNPLSRVDLRLEFTRRASASRLPPETPHSQICSSRHVSVVPEGPAFDRHLGGPHFLA